MLLNECIDALATRSTIAGLDKVPVEAKVNACTLGGTITVDVKDLCHAGRNALGKLLANPAH